MGKKVNLQCNKIIHLEDPMVIYNIYNLQTLEKLIDTVHNMHNPTTLNGKLFAGTLDVWYSWCLTKDGTGDYAINSLLYFRTVREKYVKMYKMFIDQYLSMRRQ